MCIRDRSIVSALILGDAAVGAGIASRITIIVVAISTLSYFLIPKIYGAVSFWSIEMCIRDSYQIVQIIIQILMKYKQPI